MLKATVKTNKTETIKGTAKSGKEYSLIVQNEIYVTNGEERFQLPITLDDNQSPYEPGEYQFSVEEMIQKGRFGLEVKPFFQPKLIKILKL